jgi:hypothetical protein
MKSLSLANNIRLNSTMNFKKKHDLSAFGFSLIYSESNIRNPTEKKRLAVISGWMGAKPNQLKPYINYYHSRGIDTLSFGIKPIHLLFPNRSKNAISKVLEICKEYENDLTKSNLIFHHFSVGGFLFGQILCLMNELPEQFGVLKPAIKAQIFDSPPDYVGIAKGVSRSFNIGSFFEKILEMCISKYLKVTANTAGKEHKLSSVTFHNNSLNAPSLWYYSLADKIARYEDCQVVINKWKGRGIAVSEVVWEHTPHIQHARIDPKRYFNELDNFLLNSNLIDNNIIINNNNKL